MKLIHLSDLHIGKRLCEYPLIEDQRYIIEEILEIIKKETPDGVIIAGDIYDKAVPTEEAVELFDDFLYRLSMLKTQVFIISGNHDSAERLSFASRLIDASGIHISSVYGGQTLPYTLKDDFGEVMIYMLPFVKPADVRRFFPDAEIKSYSDALGAAVKNMNIDKTKRNVLITHQFVTGALRSDSEDISVGGTDTVNAEIFNDFDYVALGHIHKAQNIGCEKIRYCGTPLKYSVSEAQNDKSVTVAELCKKGELKIKTVPLKPLRDVTALKGTYLELTDKTFYEGTSYTSDYVYITLTDEEDIVDAARRLGVIYKNLLGIAYDNARTRKNQVIEAEERAEEKLPSELFEELYMLQNNSEMSEKQKKYLKQLIEDVWEARE